MVRPHRGGPGGGWDSPGTLVPGIALKGLSWLWALHRLQLPLVESRSEPRLEVRKSLGSFRISFPLFAIFKGVSSLRVVPDDFYPGQEKSQRSPCDHIPCLPFDLDLAMGSLKTHPPLLWPDSSHHTRATHPWRDVTTPRDQVCRVLLRARNLSSYTQ